MLPTIISLGRDELNLPPVAAKWVRVIQRLSSVFEVWINRSSDFPLSLAFRGSHKVYPGQYAPVRVTKHLEELVRLVCATSSRWKSLELDVYLSNESPFLPVFYLPPDQVPMLEYIKLAIVFDLPDLGLPDNGSSDAGFTAHIRGLAEQMGIFKSKSLRSLNVSNMWQSLLALPVDYSVVTCLCFGGYAIDIARVSELNPPPRM